MDLFPHMWPVALDETRFIAAVIISAFMGALLGLERSIAGKHAGMRTYALVSMGSCLFVVLGTLSSFQLSAFFSGINPLQLAGSIIVGIGFIGSGLAVFRGEHPVELTTATGIWLAAGVGMACGFGFYLLAFVATLMGLAIFTLFLKVENVIRTKYGTKTD